MTTYNWKFIKTKGGKKSACLCIGDRLHREYDDFNLALMMERAIVGEGNEITGQKMEEFFDDHKNAIEASQSGLKHSPKIIYTPAPEFRALQRKLEKEEEKK